MTRLRYVGAIFVLFLLTFSLAGVLADEGIPQDSHGTGTNATLIIISAPPNATVYINGTPYGNTPLNITLQPGIYQINVTKEGYQANGTVVSLGQNETRVLNITLTPTWGYLTINSTPSNATVYIDGKEAGRTPLINYTLVPGNHSITLVKPGYEEYRENVTITPGETISIVASLSPQPAELGVNSNPSGAAVYINDEYKGATPISLTLKPGSYTVKLSLEGYANITKNLTLGPGENKTLNFNLTPLPSLGYLTINSTPANATVYLDGDYIGTTPLENYPLPPGNHTITIVKRGYENYTETIQVEGNTPLFVNVTLKPLTATVKVLSTPIGAEVYLDGESIGKTPGNFTIPSGSHTITLHLDGYLNYTTAVTVSPGETKVVNATLIPIPAKLSINSTPSGASVYINGSYKGETPLTLNLTPGVYNVTISKQGYDNYTTTITLNPGENRRIKAKLTHLTGYITVYTTPGNATVYIDGKEVGKTPLIKYNITPGKHRLTIKLNGYKEYDKNITINPGENPPLNVTLTKVSGKGGILDTLKGLLKIIGLIIIAIIILIFVIRAGSTGYAKLSEAKKRSEAENAVKLMREILRDLEIELERLNLADDESVQDSLIRIRNALRDAEAALRRNDYRTPLTLKKRFITEVESLNSRIKPYKKSMEKDLTKHAVGRTYLGRRENNEDAYTVEKIGGNILLAVADGMGGHLAGEVASKTAIDTLREILQRKKLADPAEVLRDAIIEANRKIYEMGHDPAHPERYNMGTTLTAAVVRGDTATVANIGDSRTYLIKPGGTIQRLTKDHSLVQELVDKGEITEEEARRHPQKNVITKALGIEPEIKIDEGDIKKVNLQEGDYLLLCSDGLTDALRDEEIASTLLAAPSLEEAAKMLIEKAYAYGSNDNITVVIYRH
ncbi:hypothetical protein A3L09_09605 [Thermococcus profundus]|uniref:PPM-type phosphatase domain-containing protein n=1 Tax=Thermococcus profundus TaxID=49899 RepID=A0A2Z2MAS4_THEPR|nr:Stp1/IreP family PP2C-type Ser/Thr phosphatase [Thermococcus profundus]ASJ03497.1 hypothetical protein A3L09_09605 [Thermococcus profundus]